MKRLLLTLTVFMTAATLSANDAALRTYAERAMQKCPGSIVSIERIDQAGPSNFTAYRAKQQSSDEHCAGQSWLLFSPVTQQTFLGSVIALPNDPRPADVRLGEHATNLLKAPITAKISPMAIADGLKPVTLTKQTQYGPFVYSGYLDASQRFLLVGMRGSLKEDPAVTLRKALGMEAAARRGNSVSKIEIIELSDFQCPTCARAHDSLEPLITKNLGRISYARLDLPLFEHHQWSLPAAMGARAIQRVAPAKYWQYVDHVFKNQEPLANLDFDKFLKEFVEDSDIDWKAVEKIYRSKAERTALLDQVSRAFSVGINSTPTLIVNGQRMGFGETGYALEAIKQTLGAATTTSTSSSTKKK